MNKQNQSHLADGFDNICAGTIFGIISVSCLVLVGWYFDVSCLKNLNVGLIPMQWTAAVAFLLTGISLWLSQEKRASIRANRIVALGLALVVTVMGLLPLMEHLLGWNLGIEPLISQEQVGKAPFLHPSRMASNTGFTLVLAGLSLLLLDVRTRRGRSPAQYLIVFGTVVVSIALVGYIYGTPQLYAPVSQSNAMPFPVVMAGNLAFLGLWLSRRGSNWMALLTGEGAGSVMARRFLLPLLLVPIALDVVLIVGEHAQYYNYHMENAIHVVLTVCMFLPVVFIAARSLNKADAENRKATADKARLAAIVVTSNDAILTKNLDGTIQSWNPAAERLFGYREDEILGKSITRIVPPECLVEEEQIQKRLANGERIEHFETVRVAKDGRRVDVSVTISLLKDDSGREIGASKIIRDTTQRRQAEARLRLLAAALQSSANAIAISGRDGDIQWVNTAFTSLTGYTSEEAVGLNPNVLKSGRHDAAFYKQMWDTILSGRAWHGELVNKRKDGTLYTEEATIAPVSDLSGSITHFIAVKQDITDRKWVEHQMLQQKERLEGINRIFEQALGSQTEENLGKICLAVAGNVTGSEFGILCEINAGGQLDCIAISNGGMEVCQIQPRGADKPHTSFEIRGIYGSVIKDEKGFFTNDPAAHPDRIGLPPGHPPLQSLLGVPLKQDGRTIGLVAVGNREGGYSADELASLEALAPVMVEAFLHKRSEAALKEAHNVLETRVMERTAELKEAKQIVEGERGRFKDVLDHLPAYLILLSPDDQVPFANRFFMERFGSVAARPANNSDSHRKPSYGPKNKAPHHWEWTAPDGRHYDIYDYPFTDADGSPLIMEVGLDVTERNRADAALKHLNDTLEQRVADRTAELRASNEEAMRLNQAMVGRELRMIELKKEINKLCGQLGEPPRYSFDFEKGQPGTASAR